jgi:hypothetical protein
MDGRVATEDEVATILDRLQGVVAAEIHGLSVVPRKLRAYHPGPVIELLTNDVGAETVSGCLQNLGSAT